MGEQPAECRWTVRLVGLKHMVPRGRRGFTRHFLGVLIGTPGLVVLHLPEFTPIRVDWAASDSNFHPWKSNIGTRIEQLTLIGGRRSQDASTATFL